jgi:hypothetical protein
MADVLEDLAHRKQLVGQASDVLGITPLLKTG